MQSPPGQRSHPTHTLISSGPEAQPYALTVESPNERDDTNSRIARAASSMSHRYAASFDSGCIQRLAGLEDFVATEGIAKGLPGEEIDVTTEYLTKLCNHVHPLVKAPLRVF